VTAEKHDAQSFDALRPQMSVLAQLGTATFLALSALLVQPGGTPVSELSGSVPPPAAPGSLAPPLMVNTLMQPLILATMVVTRFMANNLGSASFQRRGESERALVLLSDPHITERASLALAFMSFSHLLWNTKLLPDLDLSSAPAAKARVEEAQAEVERALALKRSADDAAAEPAAAEPAQSEQEGDSAAAFQAEAGAWSQHAASLAAVLEQAIRRSSTRLGNSVWPDDIADEVISVRNLSRVHDARHFLPPLLHAAVAGGPDSPQQLALLSLVCSCLKLVSVPGPHVHGLAAAGPVAMLATMPVGVVIDSGEAVIECLLARSAAPDSAGRSSTATQLMLAWLQLYGRGCLASTAQMQAHVNAVKSRQAGSGGARAATQAWMATRTLTNSYQEMMHDALTAVSAGGLVPSLPPAFREAVSSAADQALVLPGLQHAEDAPLSHADDDDGAARSGADGRAHVAGQRGDRAGLHRQDARPGHPAVQPAGSALLQLQRLCQPDRAIRGGPGQGRQQRVQRLPLCALLQQALPGRRLEGPPQVGLQGAAGRSAAAAAGRACSSAAAAAGGACSSLKLSPNGMPAAIIMMAAAAAPAPAAEAAPAVPGGTGEHKRQEEQQQRARRSVQCGRPQLSLPELYYMAAAWR
jgi:uncharacterized protein YukE